MRLHETLIQDPNLGVQQILPTEFRRKREPSIKMQGWHALDFSGVEEVEVECE